MTARVQSMTIVGPFFTFLVGGLMVLLAPASSLAVQRSSKSSHRGPPLPAKSDPAAAAQRKLRLEKIERDMKATEDRFRSRMPAEWSKMPELRDSSDFRGPKAPELPPFVPAAAPPAEECLRAYFAAAKEATSMDQLLDYLPHKEQKTLRERQANHDPRKAVASQERLRKKDPDMSEEQITFLTNSPYANALDRHKKRANKFLDVLSAESDGNKATIVISTLSMAKSLGQKYPYSKATIEMVGEAGYWRIDTYNDSSWHYKVPPTTP